MYLYTVLFIIFTNIQKVVLLLTERVDFDEGMERNMGNCGKILLPIWK